MDHHEEALLCASEHARNSRMPVAQQDFWHRAAGLLTAVLMLVTQTGHIYTAEQLSGP